MSYFDSSQSFFSSFVPFSLHFLTILLTYTKSRCLDLVIVNLYQDPYILWLYVCPESLHWIQLLQNKHQFLKSAFQQRHFWGILRKYHYVMTRINFASAYGGILIISRQTIIKKKLVWWYHLLSIFLFQWFYLFDIYTNWILFLGRTVGAILYCFCLYNATKWHLLLFSFRTNRTALSDSYSIKIPFIDN